VTVTVNSFFLKLLGNTFPNNFIKFPTSSCPSRKRNNEGESNPSSPSSACVTGSRKKKAASPAAAHAPAPVVAPVLEPALKKKAATPTAVAAHAPVFAPVLEPALKKKKLLLLLWQLLLLLL
jgi:hypothetical protein